MDRLGGARGWTFVNGLPFADEVTKLFDPDEHIFYPASFDERGNALPVGEMIMTGTQHTGVLDPGNNCNDWSSTAAQFFGGLTGYGGLGWTDASGTDCSQSGRLICFGLGRIAVVAPTPPAAKRLVFLTQPWQPQAGGLAAADARCASEAASAGLPGTYRALLATAGSSALSRFSASGAAWYRPDDVKVANSTADFAAGILSAPVTVIANGQVELTNRAVWTGAATPAVAGSNTCGDWTTPTAGLPASIGISYATDGRYFHDTFNVAIDCSFVAASVYCLQE
jgi:hypothetical protein